MAEVLRVKCLSVNAQLPRRGSPLSAGLDLFSAEARSLPPRSRAVIALDLAMAVPEGCYGRIAPRSSFAARFGIDVGAGVIDADYRGAVSVVLFNHSDKWVDISLGDRVAQLIIERIAMPAVQAVDDLEDTQRGSGGFGSTGGFGAAVPGTIPKA